LNVALGLVIVAMAPPVIDAARLLPAGMHAAHAFNRLGGKTKTPWASMYREWCRKHSGKPRCHYVNSVKTAKCTKTDIRNLAKACPAQ